MLNGLLARKLGMTQVFAPDGTLIPVTVLEAGPCYVVQRRTKEKDGYDAVQVGFLTQKPQRLTKPVREHLKKAGFADNEPMPRHLKEFRINPDDEFELGQEIKVADVFAEGDKVAVTGKSKGKGFAGVIKRHGFHRGPMSHGSRFHRFPGSAGPSATPSHVRKGKKNPGHAGNKTVTVKNLEVVAVDPENNLLLVKGAVPGAVRSLVVVRKK